MKHTKKSMFISTILMVVLLVAALSTATYAWFSSNNTVTATQTTMTAATTSDANIGIGWSEASAKSGNTAISFESMTGLKPLMPLNRPSSGLAAEATSTDQYVASKYGDRVSPEVITDGVTYKTVAKTFYYVSFSQADITAGKTISILTASALDKDFKGVQIGAQTAHTKLYVKALAQAEHYALKDAQMTGDWADQEGGYVVDGIATDQDYLRIVADEAVPGANDIKITDAKADVEYAAIAASMAVGKFIYKMAATPIYYMTVAAGQTAAAGTYVAAGTPGYPGLMGTNDYLTILTDETKVEDGEMLLEDAKASYVTGAVIGDYIYAVRKSAAVARTTYDVFSASFNTATIDAQGRFNNNPTATNPVSLTEFGAAGTTFFISNNGAVGSAAPKIKMTASITGDNAVDLRLAVFVKNAAAGDGDYLYMGTLASTAADTVYGKIILGAGSTKASGNLSSYTATLCTAGFASLATIAAENSIEVKLVAWFDGQQLINTDGGKDAQFVLNFEAVA